MASIRKRTWITKSGKEKFCYEITFYHDGKLIRKSGFKTKGDALMNLQKVTKTFDSNVIFSNLIDDYMQFHCELQCKNSTIDLYKNYKNISLKDLLYKKAKEITKRDIEYLILNLMKKMGNKSINNVIAFAQSVFDYGISNEWISENPVKKINKLPLGPRKMCFLSEKQMQLFLKNAKTLTPSYYAFFATALLTGMRRGELLAIEWSDIDFKGKKINVCRQRYKGEISSTKTFGSTRSINISDDLLQTLKEHKLSSAILGKMVFCNDKGGYIHPYNMASRYFKPVVKATIEQSDEENDISKLRFHDLRHTYATYLLSNNVPVKFVQLQLGHTNSRTTLDTYGHVMPSVNDKAMNILNNLKYEHKMSTEIGNI